LKITINIFPGDSIELTKTADTPKDYEEKNEKIQVIIQSTNECHQNLPVQDVASSLFDKWGNYKGVAVDTQRGQITGFSQKSSSNFLKQTVTMVDSSDISNNTFESSNMTTAATEIYLPHGTSLSYLSETASTKPGSSDGKTHVRKNSCAGPFLGGFGDPR